MMNPSRTENGRFIYDAPQAYNTLHGLVRCRECGEPFEPDDVAASALPGIYPPECEWNPFAIVHYRCAEIRDNRLRPLVEATRARLGLR